MTDYLENCGQNKCSCEGGKERCVNWVLFIFSVIFTLALGLTLGVVLAERISVAVSSLVTATVIMAILVAVTAIYKKCINNN